jgi:hypothetical protein
MSEALIPKVSTKIDPCVIPMINPAIQRGKHDYQNSDLSQCLAPHFGEGL